MTRDQHEHPTGDTTPPTPDPDSPLFDDEGDLGDDRQDPPEPAKTSGDDGEIDGTTATPGDEPED